MTAPLSPEERQIARLADSFDFAALRQMMAEGEQLAISKLAQKTYALPEKHDRIEWERLQAYWDGVEYVFQVVERAQAAVRKDVQQREVTK